MSKINWQEIGDSDYKATYKGYFLRLEQMDKNLWWFQAYIDDEPLWHEKNMTATKEEAEREILETI